MKKEIFFTIIITVYNVGKYIKECVESFLDQDYKNFEMLLINDGSTDDSADIIDYFSRIDSRIHVIHKANGGQSTALNEGIRNAEGKWILIIDGDDYVEDKCFLNKLYTIAIEKAADVITYGHTKVRERDKGIIERCCFHMEKINKLEKEEAKLQELLNTGMLSDSACTYAYLRSHIINHNLFFDEELKSAADIEWVIRLFLTEPKLYAMNGSPYMYRIRKGSQCTRKRQTGFWRWRYSAIKKSLYSLENSTLSEKQLLPWYQYLAYAYYILLGQIWDEPDVNVREKAFGEIQEMKKLQIFRGNKKINLCRNIVSVFGTKWGAVLQFIYTLSVLEKRANCNLKACREKIRRINRMLRFACFVFLSLMPFFHPVNCKCVQQEPSI